MRLPVSSVYRAFPELDRFSDEVCAGCVKRAAARNRGSQVLASFGAIILAVIVFVVSFYVSMGLADAVSSSRNGGRTPFFVLPLMLALALLCAAITGFVSGICLLMMRPASPGLSIE